MNKLNNIKYFLNQIPGLAVNSFALYFDFESGDSLSTILPATGFQDFNQNYLFSGLISSNELSFWEKSGVGTISDNYIYINNDSNNINFQNFTCMSVLQNHSPGGGTILSTIETGEREAYDEYGVPIKETFFKGFEFGLTSNNKLYYEYFNKQGVQVLTSDFFVPDKSSVFLRTSLGSVSFGYYDFSKNKLLNVDYYFDTNFIFSPNNMFIGKNPISSGLYNYNKQLRAELDQFLIFSPAIYDYEMQNINSGFATIYFPESVYIQENYSTGIIGSETGISGEIIQITGYIPTITGYRNEIIGYTTGVIDRYWDITGSYVDDFGFSGDAYGYVEITGQIELTGLVALTGIDFSVESGIIEEYAILDENYISNFGDKNINILTKVDKDDLIDIELITGRDLIFLEKNLDSFYDEISQTFVFDSIREDSFNRNYIIFANGQLLNSGQELLTGSIYNQGYLVTEDYITKYKGEIFFNDPYFRNSNTLGDFISGDIKYLNNFNIDSGVEILNQIPNLDEYNFFINGQKLLNNFHYTINNNSINFNITTEIDFTGKMMVVPKNFDYVITGSNQHLFRSNYSFYKNYSQVYKNGIRQFNNFDYLEVSNFSTNTGIPILDIKNNLIYNNNTLFTI